MFHEHLACTATSLIFLFFYFFMLLFVVSCFPSFKHPLWASAIPLSTPAGATVPKAVSVLKNVSMPPAHAFLALRTHFGIYQLAITTTSLFLGQYPCHLHALGMTHIEFPRVQTAAGGATNSHYTLGMRCNGAKRWALMDLRVRRGNFTARMETEGERSE